MQSYLVDSTDGIDALKRVELPDPVAKPGEVLVRIRANSLNFRDLGITQGGYLRNDKRPVIPLSDGAGEVVDVGTGVTRFKRGDRVVASFFRDWIAGDVEEWQMLSSLGGGIDGTLCELVSLPETCLVADSALAVLRRSRDAPLRCCHRVAGAGFAGQGEGGRCRAHPGDRRRLDLCASVREAPWSHRDRDKFERRRSSIA